MRRFAAPLGILVFSVLSLAAPAQDGRESSQPRLTQQEANRAAISWLKRSEKEFTQVTKIPNDFPDEHWWPEIIRAYVDAGDNKAAGEFSARWHKKFGQSCGRETIRLAAIRLSEHGQFVTARQVALILVQQNNPMLLGFSMSQNEQLCVETLVQITGRQAAAGDYSGAKETADMIPRKRYPDERSAAFYLIALGHAQHGDANGIRQLHADYANYKAKGDHETALLFAVELAMAGAVEDALQLTDTLPATSRRLALVRIALAQAIEGNWSAAIQTTEQISKVDERKMALLQLAAVKAWSGDYDGGIRLVDEHIQADQVDHPFRSAYFICRDTLDRARAWAGDVNAAEQTDAGQISTRLRLGQILDYSADEESIRPSNDPLQPSVFECPRKLTPLGLSAFMDATAETLPFLEMLARGEHIRANIVTFADGAHAVRKDDFSYLSSMYSQLGATCALAGDQVSAAQFFGKALEAADEADFRAEENLSYLLCSRVRLGDADTALRNLNRVIHVKSGRRRVLSNLSAQVAFAMAEAGTISELEELLKIAPRQADRALICLGAAQGFLSSATQQVDTPVPRDAYEMLVRCNLPLPLPQVRGPMR